MESRTSKKEMEAVDIDGSADQCKSAMEKLCEREARLGNLEETDNDESELEQESCTDEQAVSDDDSNANDDLLTDVNAFTNIYRQRVAKEAKNPQQLKQDNNWVLPPNMKNHDCAVMTMAALSTCLDEWNKREKDAKTRSQHYALLAKELKKVGAIEKDKELIDLIQLVNGERKGPGKAAVSLLLTATDIWKYKPFFTHIKDYTTAAEISRTIRDPEQLVAICRNNLVLKPVEEGEEPFDLKSATRTQIQAELERRYPTPNVPVKDLQEVVENAERLLYALECKKGKKYDKISSDLTDHVESIKSYLREEDGVGCLNSKTTFSFADDDEVKNLALTLFSLGKISNDEHHAETLRKLVEVGESLLDELPQFAGALDDSLRALASQLYDVCPRLRPDQEALRFRLKGLADVLADKSKLVPQAPDPHQLLERIENASKRLMKNESKRYVFFKEVLPKLEGPLQSYLGIEASKLDDARRKAGRS